MTKLINIILISAFSLGAIFNASCGGGSKQPENVKKETSESAATGKITKVTISKRGYEPKEIAVKKGQLVRLEFYRADGENCGEELVFPKLNIKKSLPVGATETVEFTPQETGEIVFTCGMDMLRGKVIVSD